MIAQDSVLLVAGPHVPETVLRRHCLCALEAGRPVALVPLWPLPLGERLVLGALRGWFGRGSIRLVENHRDWVEVGAARTTVVLSDSGIWRDDERVTDAGELRRMPRTAIEALYRVPSGQPENSSVPPSVR